MIQVGSSNHADEVMKAGDILKIIADGHSPWLFQNPPLMYFLVKKNCVHEFQ